VLTPAVVAERPDLTQQAEDAAAAGVRVLVQVGLERVELARARSLVLGRQRAWPCQAGPVGRDAPLDGTVGYQSCPNTCCPDARFERRWAVQGT